MEKNRNEKIEAATFRRLIKHFKENPNIQNIDLMELAGFCRNCISKWYLEEAKQNGVELNYDEAKEIVYSMSYKNSPKRSPKRTSTKKSPKRTT